LVPENGFNSLFHSAGEPDLLTLKVYRFSARDKRKISKIGQLLRGFAGGNGLPTFPRRA
jgi:hypothetical protein